MLEIIPFDEGNIIGFRLSGKMEDDEFDKLVGMMEEMLKEHKKLRVYAEVEAFKGMSVNTFMKDLHYSLKHWRDVEREAVVSEKGWMKTWVDFASKLVPNVEVKFFPFEEKEEAKAWVRG
ncbi:MAG: STAS/SEC14 domain-containing protein [Thermodesulfobacteriota bacterium]